MAPSGNIIAKCLLFVAISAYATAQKNTTTSNKPEQPIFIPIPMTQPGRYPMQPLPVKALPVQPMKSLPVQPVKALPVQPVTNAHTWPLYYPYHQPANEYSQVMNIFLNDNYEPPYYLIPITEEKAADKESKKKKPVKKEKNQSKPKSKPKSKGKEANRDDMDDDEEE